ncbi:MAG: hypothetical protein LUQ59_07265 [Methanothrix sp.]|nr:hypothetical protein [Methanothrix sp.]
MFLGEEEKFRAANEIYVLIRIASKAIFIEENISSRVTAEEKLPTDKGLNQIDTTW